MSGTAPSPPPGQGGSVLPEGRRGMLLSDEPCFSEPSQSSLLRYRAARRLPTTSEVSPVSARPYISALSLLPRPSKKTQQTTGFLPGRGRMKVSVPSPPALSPRAPSRPLTAIAASYPAGFRAKLHHVVGKSARNLMNNEYLCRLPRPTS